ncbi:MAG TPA: phage portal protein [Devosiaceae bacterium]
MPSIISRLTGGRANAPSETKTAQTLFTLTGGGGASWTGRGYASLAGEGYRKNPVVYRCVRMIAEAAGRVPLAVREGGRTHAEHPLVDLLRRPNPHRTGVDLLETVFAHLQTAGNAYLEAAVSGGEIRGLYVLRPDRMRVVAGADGWPVAYSYTAGGRVRRLPLDPDPVPRVLHLTLFHPLDDHYGLAPLEAAGMSLDVHNAASRWNKALLDNAARPSGALVYSAQAGNLTPAQFDRLKAELETGFQGAANAGRPMVLEGGLDWKTLALSPRDMDFIEAKNAAAREIALAFGVPPMLLGIPGDNTFANYAEANRSLWRQTVVPLVNRASAALGAWLSPAFGDDLTLIPDLDAIEALAEDRTAKWNRIANADFLSDVEKRQLLGIPPAARPPAR